VSGADNFGQVSWQGKFEGWFSKPVHANPTTKVRNYFFDLASSQCLGHLDYVISSPPKGWHVAVRSWLLRIMTIRYSAP
jgi:hypothetical protein